jgi:hypothetical protein
MPSAAYTHVIVAKQGNVLGSGVAARDFCANGSCP